MLKILPESNGNRLAVRAGDLLTDEDYEKAFIPAMEKLIEEHGKIRVAIDFDETFRGWEPAALWDDAKFGVRHASDFEKVALVGATLLVEWAAKIGDRFTDSVIETFETGEFEKAWHWLNA